MDYSYHNHTFRCNHATGTPEEYIVRAIENGIKYMGFSEHFPYICRDGFEARYRLPTASVGEYFSELNALREKYAGRIEIKIGFEMEYYPETFDGMLKKAREYGAEYLILGQHFLSEEHPGGVYAMSPIEEREHLEKYVANVVEGIKTGVFSYVAHPDVINYAGGTMCYCLHMSDICKAARDHNVPLEINFLGIRGERNYPKGLFWEMAGKYKAPVTFGFDAHDAMNAYDGVSLVRAKALVEEYKLNYIGRPELKKL